MAEEIKKSVFDAAAAGYDEGIPPHVMRHYLEKRIGFIKGLINSGAILDVGCGTGSLAQRLTLDGYDVSGADSSAGMLEECRRKGFLKVFQAASTALPFDSGSFDLVFSVAVFHHIGSEEKVAATVKEMARVCRPGGKILIWDHNPLNPYWKIFMKRLPWDEGGVRLVPAKEICADLRAAGIREMRVYKSGFVADFIPPALLPAMQAFEKILENMPIVRELSAHNVILAGKGE